MKTMIVVPVHNEADAIRVVLPALANQVQGIAEIVVNCNGSSDDSAAVAESLGFHVMRQVAPGKPQAVRVTFEFALEQGATHLIVFDGDGQHPPEAVPNMIRMLKTFPIVKGSRFLESSVQIGTPLDRQMVLVAVRALVREFAHVEVTDPPCGLIGMNAELARFFLDTLDWEVEWEIEALFALNRYRPQVAVREFSIPAIYEGLPGAKQAQKYDPDGWGARIDERFGRQARAIHRFITKYQGGE